MYKAAIRIRSEQADKPLGSRTGPSEIPMRREQKPCARSALTSRDTTDRAESEGEPTCGGHPGKKRPDR